MGASISTDDFNTAATTVIAVIERGYHPTRNPTPLDASDWAKLACALLAAIGRGYHCQQVPGQETKLDKARAEALDPNPLTPDYPTFFHRLAATAEDVVQHVKPGQVGYQDWYANIKKGFNEKATKAAAAEVDEKWLTWKANELDRLAMAHETEIAAEARKGREKYFIATASRLGLCCTSTGSVDTNNSTPPVSGRKRTASGSAPDAKSTTPAGPRPDVMTTTAPERHTISPVTTPRGRVTPSPANSLIRMRVDTPPLKTPITQAILALSPRATLNLRVNKTPTHATVPGPLGIDAITAAIKAALGPAIQAAMVPYAAKLNALEKATMPPPLVARPARRNNRANPPITSAHPPPSPCQESQLLQEVPEAPAPAPPACKVRADSGFILIDRQSKKWKDKATANGQPPTAPVQTNPTSASYADTAAIAANIQQPQTPRRRTNSPPAITEITVLRTGGHFDPQVETQIRTRAADAIVREVRTKMAKAVAKPISLRAGRWSIHPRSKGNFVFSFDGCIPFDIIQSYERLLLEPFYGSGKLCPSMGWTRFLVHGVPVWSDENTAFGPHSILEEVRSLPGLKKAVFAMEPRWLRPVGSIASDYSSITFAISDPNNTNTNILLNSRSALFGKEVTICKWIDKPALIQCSRCHTLGHNKASKTCQLAKDSVKCMTCGGAHRSEKHDQHCPRKHVVAGICDCTHFKCLNCHKTGHNCRDIRCPARDLYRPRGTRKSGKAKGKSDARPVVSFEEQTSDSDGDLYAPLPVEPPPPQPQPSMPEPPSHPTPTELTPIDLDRMEEYYERIDWQDDDNYVPDWYADPPQNWRVEQPTGWGATSSPQHRAYSPSRLSEDANPMALA